MSPRVRRNLGFVVVAAIVVGASFLYVTRFREAPAGVQGLAPVGGNLFAEGDVIQGATRGLLSPDGSNLAVLSPDGLGIVVRGNDVRPVTEEGSRVVDAAWFGNGGTLLVAEGPVPTGLLAIVDVDGTVRGSVPLEPSVGFGRGYGMAVAPGGRAAVVTAVARPALGAEQRHLVHVDLETGATRDLTTSGGPDEERPFFLDADRVAFVEMGMAGEGEGDGDVGGVRTREVSLADGSVRDVAPGVRIVGVTSAGEPVLERDGTLLVDGRRIGEVPGRTSLSSIHPATGLAVVSESATAADGSTVVRLRRLEVTPAR